MPGLYDGTPRQEETQFLWRSHTRTLSTKAASFGLIRRMESPLSLFHLGGRPTWKMPELTQINRLPGHARLIPFSDATAALAQPPKDSPYFQCLNGRWRFRYLEKPESITTGMLGGDGEECPEIDVPGVWTRQGYGYPHYTNVQMPFPNDPPDVPEENPVGIYQRRIRIPAAWQGRRTIVHFGGAESVLLVFVDGRAVGLSKDSRLPSEFDLTDFVTPGVEHTLTAVVIKWSDASFIEDQDQWWMGGLHRDVFLYSTAPAALWDVFVNADPTEDGGGRLRVRLTPEFFGAASKGFQAGFQLHDNTAGIHEELSAILPVFGPDEPYASERMLVDLKTHFEKVEPWTAETPRLYKLLVWIESPEGVREYARVDIGFRTIAIRDGELCVNGRPLRIHGVNRHEHDDVTGKAISRESMERDIRLFKENNINAVRTSHYPNHPYFYELCDRHGIYVVDEANIECHSHFQTICRDPRYLPAFVDRVSNMVLRDKNHPSVLLWSLGNESGMGSNHEAAAGWIRGFDPSRPLHYEGGISISQSHADWHQNHRVTDIVCPMYASHQALIEWAENPERDRRPVILCEYSHAMGNSNGGLGEYYDIFEKYRGFQGGFVWEFVDHGLRAETATGEVYWKYGGDFGDTPNDANFVCDGLVGPDRQPHPGLLELRHLARPVAAEFVTTASASTRIRLRNKRQFAPLTNLVGRWILRLDGTVVSTGEFPVPAVNAGLWEEIELPIGCPDKGEAHLDLHFSLRETEGLLPAGHEVAVEHLVLRERPSADLREPSPARIEFPETNGDTPLVAGDLCATISAGRLASLAWKGENILSEAARLHLFRAPTDNDGLKLWSGQDHKALGRWLGAGLHQLWAQKPRVSFDGTAVISCEDWMNPSGQVLARLTSRFLADEGWIISDHWVELDPNTPEMPRVGLALVLRPGFENIAYFGRGPWENYIDRKRSARLAVHESTVTSEYVPYVMPQEHGHHTDCRWLRIASDHLQLDVDGGGAHFGFAARHMSDEDLFAARHTIDLPRRNETFLYLDHRHTGLGTESCGPGRLPQHQILEKSFAFRFRFRLGQIPGGAS